MIFASLKYSLKNSFRRIIASAIDILLRKFIKACQYSLLYSASSSNFSFHFFVIFYSFPFLILISLSLLCLSQYLQTPFSSEWIHFHVIFRHLTTQAQSNYYEWEKSLLWSYLKKSYYSGNVDSALVLWASYLVKQNFITIVHFLCAVSLSTTLISFLY